MTLLAQLSDFHVRVGRDDRSAAAKAGATVRAVLAHDPAPDAVIVTGDLADTPSDAEYERVRELLAPLPMPVHVLAGNHDDAQAVSAHFGQPPRYVASVGDLRVIGCDTSIPGRGDGALGAEGLAWLEERLGEDTRSPTLVAMHHAPLLVGVPAMDASRLADADRRALGALLARSPHVLRVLAGHVHRTTFAVLGGVPVFACPATSSQLVLDPSARESEDLEFTDEPPGYALHRLADGELNTYVLAVRGGPPD